MTEQRPPSSSNENPRRLSRREWIAAGCTAVAGSALALTVAGRRGGERGLRADVFVARVAGYDEDLERPIREGLARLGVNRKAISGKRVLLKPNLVETAIGLPHINTHPAMVVAAAEVFRGLDARGVIVAEGQGHRRDSRLVLDESRMGAALDAAGLPFVDLNHDDVYAVPNKGRWSKLRRFYLPQTIRQADILVSMPKLKTHHWVGMTCAMKNLFGVMPGIVYGWPKNVLHTNGIANSILDINATVQPDLAIVDGIIGMEGDGPIMGDPISTQCIVMGRNLPAVDATCARMMNLNVDGITYLHESSGILGPVREEHIAQHGVAIDTVRRPFAVLDLPHLASVRRS